MYCERVYAFVYLLINAHIYRYVCKFFKLNLKKVGYKPKYIKKYSTLQSNK